MACKWRTDHRSFYLLALRSGGRAPFREYNIPRNQLKGDLDAGMSVAAAVIKAGFGCAGMR